MAVVRAGLRARATIEARDDAWDRLGKVYRAPDAEFPAPPTPGWVLRYSVERITGVGPWVPDRH